MERSKDKRIHDIQELVRSIPDETERISILEEAGFHVEHKPMKGYWLGQVRRLRHGICYIQVGTQHGKWKYAPCVILKENQLSIFNN